MVNYRHGRDNGYIGVNKKNKNIGQ